MSRIHEALKKAEEQKVASQAGQGGAAVQPMLEDPAIAEVLPMAPPAVTAAPRTTLETPEVLTWETIVARCPQRQWNPTKGMLFLNKGSHQDAGAEEFRTLRSRLYHLREKRRLIKPSTPLAFAVQGDGDDHVALEKCTLRRDRAAEDLPQPAADMRLRFQKKNVGFQRARVSTASPRHVERHLLAAPARALQRYGMIF